jgi:hypothetical protein
MMIRSSLKRLHFTPKQKWLKIIFISQSSSLSTAHGIVRIKTVSEGNLLLPMFHDEKLSTGRHGRESFL